jgi:hypothetical protein
VASVLAVVLLSTRIDLLMAGPPRPKVTICHFPPGNHRPVTIEVSEAALRAHLAHNDTMGACGYSSLDASEGYLLGRPQGGFSVATTLAVFSLVGLTGLARLRS